MERDRFLEMVHSYSKVKIGVLGDIVMDRFVYGEPERLSREAPVVVLRYESEEIFPGCAGNTLRNLQDLGASVFPVSLLGEDAQADEMLKLFQKGRVSTDYILKLSGQETVRKTRILAGDFHTKKQQIVRIDRGKGLIPGPEDQKRLVNFIESLSKEVDGWIVSDYGYQLVNGEIIELISKIAARMPVVVDSRKRVNLFQGISLITPNEGEAEEASGKKIETRSDVEVVGNRLLEQTGAKGVLITRGNQGMTLFERDRESQDIPCHGSLDIADVTGAGDTVTSVATLTLVVGGSYLDAAKLATYGASVVVMKMGTATCSKGELEQVIEEAL